MEDLFPRGLAAYAAGGLLVGAGVALVFAATGVRAGASGVLSSVVGFATRSASTARYRVEARWRFPFTAGLVAGGAVVAFLAGGQVTSLEWWRLAAGGFLVGLGTRTAGGCTSGHGICGLSSRSGRSLVHVAVFMGVAVITAHVLTGVLT